MAENWKQTQLSTYNRMDAQNVVKPFNVSLLAVLKNDYYILINMDESQNNDAEKPYQESIL